MFKVLLESCLCGAMWLAISIAYFCWVWNGTDDPSIGGAVMVAFLLVCPLIGALGFIVAFVAGSIAKYADFRGVLKE